MRLGLSIAVAALASTLASGVGAQQAQPAVEAPATVYRGATLIDGTGAAARPDVSVVVEGERIVAVGPARDVAVPKGATVIDLKGRFLLPGLIDSHVHLATPPDAAKAEAELRRLLYGGVTAVRDMADDTRSVAELQRRARVGEIPAPDIYFAALMAGPSFFDDPRTVAVSQGDTPGAVPWMQKIDEETDLVLAVARARGTYASGIKIYANLPGDLVKKITAEAHRQGVPVWAHSAVFPATPQEVIDAGVDVMSHSCPIAYQVSARMPQTYQDPTPVDAKAVGEGENPAIVSLFDQMKAKGIILDATVSIYAEGEARYARTRTGRPPRCSADLAYRLTAQAYRHGVAISAGTDRFPEPGAPYTSLHEELEMLVTKVGIPPLQAIRSATQISARSAGREKEMGTVEPGKLANLVILSGDPTRDIGALRSVVFTVKRGKAFSREDYRPAAAR